MLQIGFLGIECLAADTPLTVRCFYTDDLTECLELLAQLKVSYPDPSFVKIFPQRSMYVIICAGHLCLSFRTYLPGDPPAQRNSTRAGRFVGRRKVASVEFAQIGHVAASGRRGDFHRHISR